MKARSCGKNNETEKTVRKTVKTKSHENKRGVKIKNRENEIKLLRERSEEAGL